MSARKSRWAFEIVDIATDEVVATVDAPDNERMREKLEIGLLMKVDTERFFVREVQR